MSLKGTISLISGDNLASHYLGGNKAPSGSLRKCRHCMATSTDMQSKVYAIHSRGQVIMMFGCFISQFTEGSFQRRSRKTHSLHCSYLNGPLRDHMATTYGIERNSILNTSRYFHVTEGMVPDIMHDVLEGCALKYLIEEGVVTLKYVNDQILHFPYASSDVRNKPTPIPEATLKSSDHSVKQKGVVCNGT